MSSQVGFDSHNCVKKKGSANMFVTTVDARLLLRSAPHDRHPALVTQIKRRQNAKIKKEWEEAVLAAYHSDASIKS